MAIQYANIDKLENDLTAIADVIREKTKSDEPMIFPNGYTDEIAKLYTAADFGSSLYPVGPLSINIKFASQADHSYIFAHCTLITSIILILSLYIPASLCIGATALTFAQADKVIEIGNNSLSGCTKLGPALAFPSANGSNTRAFAGDTALKIIDYGGQGTESWLNAESFSGCSLLSTIILRNLNSPFSLKDLNVLSGTPFASGKAGGTLYVPQSLINSYKEATNWSTILSYTKSDESLLNQILPIEGSEWETKYGDGRLIADVNLASEY